MHVARAHQCEGSRLRGPCEEEQEMTLIVGALASSGGEEEARGGTGSWGARNVPIPD